MKKLRKKHIILLLFVVLAIILILILRTVPIKTFQYQTSTACSSNLYSGGTNASFKYRVIYGGLSDYSDEKSELESLNIPQTGCDGSGMSPVGYTTLQLYLL